MLDKMEDLLERLCWITLTFMAVVALIAFWGGIGFLIYKLVIA